MHVYPVRHFFDARSPRFVSRFELVAGGASRFWAIVRSEQRVRAHFSMRKTLLSV